MHYILYSYISRHIVSTRENVNLFIIFHTHFINLETIRFYSKKHYLIISLR